MKRRKDSTYKISDLISLFMIFGWLLFAWTYTLDTDRPLGSESPAVIDDMIRLTRDSFQERLDIDHYFEKTGTEVSAADAGKHRQITFQAPIATTPTVAESQGDLRIKDANGKAELTWTDEDENEVQITSAGKIYGNNLAVGSVLTAAIADANVTAAKLEGTLPDGADLAATCEANDPDLTIANKKYVDEATINPGFVKGWVVFDGTGDCTPAANLNVSSVTDNGTGDYTINWDTNFASANYCVIPSSSGFHCLLMSQTAGTTRIRAYSATGILEDHTIVCVMAIGPQ